MFAKCKSVFVAASAMTLALVVHAQEIVVIGLSGPLSGAQAQAGRDNENGLRMAIEELNAKGAAVGGKAVQFRLMSEDDQADPKTGVAVAQLLVDKGAKAVFGPYNSGVAIPASRVYNDAGVVMATVGSNPKITLQGLPYVFRIGANDTALGGSIATYSVAKLKHKTFAVIDDRTAYGQGVADEFAKTVQAAGGQILIREFTTDKATDFSAILTAIRAKKVDAIFYGGHYTQGGPLKRQMQQLGINAALLGGDAICNAELFTLGGPTINENVYCTQGGTVLASTAAGKAYVAAYQKRFQSQPLTYSVAFYDGMMALADAMKNAGSVEPKKYSPALERSRFVGVGGSFEFDAKHDLKQSPITVYTFANGVPVAKP